MAKNEPIYPPFAGIFATRKRSFDIEFPARIEDTHEGTREYAMFELHPTPCPPGAQGVRNRADRISARYRNLRAKLDISDRPATAESENLYKGVDAFVDEASKPLSGIGGSLRA